eukprot:581050-Prorocentrum_minimum.AAC.1
MFIIPLLYPEEPRFGPPQRPSEAVVRKGRPAREAPPRVQQRTHQPAYRLCLLSLHRRAPPRWVDGMLQWVNCMLKWWVKHMLKWVKHMLKWVNHMLKWVNLVTVSNQGRIQFSQTAASGIAKVQCYSPFLRRSAEALGSLPCVASRAIP